MSATRDKSQKVGFVYTNIYQLYKKSQNEAPAQAESSSLNISSDSRVWRAEDLGEIKVTKFQPRTLTRPMAPVNAAAPATAQAAAVSNNPFDDLKGNIEKLQDLHSKLRFMLKELEDLVSKK